jgi:hypothetical protein
MMRHCRTTSRTNPTRPSYEALKCSNYMIWVANEPIRRISHPDHGAALPLGRFRDAYAALG